ncbi:MAG: hypothetical protein ACFFCV_01575 [Promethearchaeota archaeon]
MMKKHIIRSISITVIIFTLLISSIPILYISSHLSTYDTYITQEPLNFETDPNTPSIEILNLKIDVGNITINYIDPSVDVGYFVKIEVYIKMCGSKLAGKSYEDYFNITWQDNSLQKNFTLEVISDEWFNPSIWFTQKIKVDVTIRKGIVFDIIATLNEGNVEINVPWGGSFKNLIVNVKNGDIKYDFDDCIIYGNITGIINSGDLILNSRNAEYTQNSTWSLSTLNGDMDLEIYHYREMGANVSGTMIKNRGILSFTYEDASTNIGALFRFPLEPAPLFPPPSVGFKIDNINQTGHYYQSFDFPAKNNYNLLFNLTVIDIQHLWSFNNST